MSGWIVFDAYVGGSYIGTYQSLGRAKAAVGRGGVHLWAHLGHVVVPRATHDGSRPMRRAPSFRQPGPVKPEPLRLRPQDNLGLGALLTSLAYGQSYQKITL